MSSRLFRRRSATAAWIYAAVACGIVGTIVAARVLGLDEYGVFATALVTVGFFQVLLDLTVEESLTKFGFRYVAGEDWGRLRRLFRQALMLKLAGGFARDDAPPRSSRRSPTSCSDAADIEQALLAASLLPLVQSSENVGATALLLHSRYDLRSVYQAGSVGPSPARDRHRRAYRRDRGARRDRRRAGDLDGRDLRHRSGRSPEVPDRVTEGARRGRSRDPLLSCSSRAWRPVSSRCGRTLVPLVLGVVSSTIQVGLFRVAQTPQTGLAAASSPARLVLMTEQTRDWERGERARILAGLRAYSKWAGALMLVAVPVFFIAMPWLIRIVFGSGLRGRDGRGADRARSPRRSTSSSAGRSRCP